MAQAEITVIIIIDSGKPNSERYEVRVPATSYGLTVMEIWARQSEQTFQITFYPSVPGYLMDKINDVAGKDGAYWHLYTGHSEDTLIYSSEGISQYNPGEDGPFLKWQLKKEK